MVDIKASLMPVCKCLRRRNFASGGGEVPDLNFDPLRELPAGERTSPSGSMDGVPSVVGCAIRTTARHGRTGTKRRRISLRDYIIGKIYPFLYPLNGPSELVSWIQT
jgi:hypothetical protein